ncbi:SDR family NAD(P)-dependent oxidoreductase [Sphaerisporangium aureirubrum]|uniref:SDR family NAD(P)-dependent oxidoreductase n=1 Tax=Sphaerisporangium aureirubrum TaxID=1544736 RepID=A0ABW1NJK0_9ACTN
MGRFEGRTVLVTGAGSGIGFHMASRFRDEGAVVYAADITPGGCPGGTVALSLDVTEERQIRETVERVLADTGRLDVLCNNAGIGSTKNPIDCTAEEWDHVFAVNVRGVFLGTKYALPAMLRQGKGAIVNTASAAGSVGLIDRAAYGASKGAVIAFTKQVAVQYAGTGVRCNCLVPGTVDSPWVGRLLDEAGDPAEARERLIARQPVGRLGVPAEIAEAALYLASDDADFVTGTELVIDGGLLAR